MTKGRNDWAADEPRDSSSVHVSPRKDLKKKRTGCSWSDSDYNLLVSLVRQYGEDWPRIARRLQHKNAKQCMQKFKNSQRSGKKGNWSKDEDDLLIAWVNRNGSTKWTECSKYIVGRCGKQCRERWVNILNPDIKKGDWSDKEQELIFSKLPTFMTSWSLMAGALVGRTENSIKNYFYSSIRRLKSNPAVSAIRDVYIDKVATCESVFQDNPSLEMEIEKLNTLSRKMCRYLLGGGASDHSFREFLLSVIFGSDIDAVGNAPSLSNTQDSGRETTPRKQQTSAQPTQVFPGPESRPMAADSRLIIPQLTSPAFPFQSAPYPRPPNLSTIIETMRHISDSKKGLDFSSFIRFLESQVNHLQVVNADSKVVLRLPTCLNCHNDCCRSKLLGV